MSLFLLLFFLIYSSFHLYAFFKARAALHFSLKTSLLLQPFLLFMIVAPIIIRLAENVGVERFARGLSVISYFWMGLLFLFVCLALALDVYRLLLAGTEKALDRPLDGWHLSRPALFWFPVLAASTICVYGYAAARDIRLEKVVIATSKIPEEIGRLRVVQVSDVHLGLIVREKRLERILKLVQQAQPDLLVSTGDLVDGQINGLPGLAERLAELDPPYGKFAVTGNHEFYAGIEQALEFTRRAGFTLLRGEAQTVGDFLTIAGVDDQAAASFEEVAPSPERPLLASLPQEHFRLFLKHRPLLERPSLGLFDLQLSGHTHQGQIFPFTLVTWLYYPQHAGTLSAENGSSLYVSRGTGTWGPPIRFLAPPEVTLIELVHEP